MSAFTDEDLKRLKDNMEAHGDHYRPGTFVMRPLLARLEASELITQRHNIEHNPYFHDYEMDEKKCEECKELKAWLKSCGK